MELADAEGEPPSTLTKGYVMDQNLTKNNSTHSNSQQRLTRTRLVEVMRIFDAPVEHVWKAWSDADLVKQWWGPEHYSCPTAKLLFRKDGNYIFAMKDPAGMTMYSAGSYVNIIPFKKIVCSDQFSDEFGKVMTPEQAGFPGKWDGDPIAYINVEFETIENGKTKMSLTHEGLGSSQHDDCVQGWNSSFNKLQRLVERM